METWHVDVQQTPLRNTACVYLPQQKGRGDLSRRLAQSIISVDASVTSVAPR